MTDIAKLAWVLRPRTRAPKPLTQQKRKKNG